MNTYDRGGLGVSGNAFDRWVQQSEVTDESAMTKMQHQYWVTKQALSRKLGKKEDECIVASDAELDAKLELFRSIQDSCFYLQRVIDKYQERLCNLAQEENSMGRFLKEAGKQDHTRAGKMMSAVGKSLSYSGQQRLALRVPLVRLYQEVETFRQRAIDDTLQNVQTMEKARTEYRAALSWMKNISQELDPDTSKQLERFRKVQIRVRNGKTIFDIQALDCLQKIDLLAAARCNMFSHALVLYQSTLLSFTKKSSQAYSTIANSFKGYQHYEFTVVKELAETSTKLSSKNNDKLSFFDSEFNVCIEAAQEVNTSEIKAQNKDEKLLDINDENYFKMLDLSINKCEDNNDNEKGLDDDDDLKKFFSTLSESNCHIDEKNTTELEKNLAELDLAMDSFVGSSNSKFDFSCLSIDGQSTSKDTSQQQSFEFLKSENIALLDNILSNEPVSSTEWNAFSKESFLPPRILQQSLGDAACGKKTFKTQSSADKKKQEKEKRSSWLNLFAELDPLADNPMESLTKSMDNNAPA